MSKETNKYLTYLKKTEAFPQDRANFSSLKDSKAAMRIITLISSFLITLIFFSSCNSSPSGPESTIDPEPGSRDYEWTVDTLNMPMNYIGTIWGASPDDVWAMGAGGTYADRLLHYDGTEWQTYTKEPIWCTGNTLFGFSANDIWMGGGAGWLDGPGAGIWHYDGSNWSPNFVYRVEGSYIVQVNDIWGTSSRNIYACGVINFFSDGIDNFRGFILHYDGNSWEEVYRADFNSQFLSIRKEQNKVYVFSFETSQISSDSERVSFYKLNGNMLSQIYSNTRGNIVFGNIHAINGKVYFLIGQDVYRYINGDFVQQLSFIHPNFGYQFYGRHEKDIFLRMRDGLAHYNGTDIEYLYNFPLNKVSIIKEPIIFEKEVFFCLRDYSGANFQNEVLHGKLKE